MNGLYPIATDRLPLAARQKPKGFRLHANLNAVPAGYCKTCWQLGKLIKIEQCNCKQNV